LALFVKYFILKAVTRNSGEKYKIKNAEMQEKNFPELCKHWGGK
jgi:hypothetical protein